MHPLAIAAGLLGLAAAWKRVKSSSVDSAKEDLEDPVAYSSGGSRALLEAEGVPYSWAAGGPSASWPGGGKGKNGGVGWDCSGFAQGALVRLGLLSPTATDRSAAGLYAASSPADGSQVGDLAFYGSSSSSVSHVMVGMGDGQVIGASGGGSKTNADDPNARVKVFSSPNYRSDFLGWRRIK